MTERGINRVPIVGRRITRTNQHADAVGWKAQNPWEQFKQFVTGGEFGINEVLSIVIPDAISSTSLLLDRAEQHNLIPIAQLTWHLVAAMEPILRGEPLFKDVAEEKIVLMDATKPLLKEIQRKIRNKVDETRLLFRDQQPINDITNNIELLLARAIPTREIPDPASIEGHQDLEQKIRNNLATINTVVETVREANKHRRGITSIIDLGYDRDPLAARALTAWKSAQPKPQA